MEHELTRVDGQTDERRRPTAATGEGQLLAPVEPCWGQCRQWQPIETAPKDGTNVLVFELGHDIPCVLRWSESARWDDSSGDSYQDYHPTHWMPLPEAPAAKDSGAPLPGDDPNVPAVETMK